MTAGTRFLSRAAFPFLVVLLIVGTAGRVVAERAAAVDTTWTVVATGLVNPKGMTFGDDGTLYVAESGKPGEVDVPLPVNFGGKGPIGTNARISRVRPGAGREDFVTGLPNVGLYGGVEMLGAASVATLNGQLYEVAAGHMTVSPKLSRVAPNGAMTAIADVGAYNNANPPPASNGDAVPLGNPYDLIALGGNLYITDGNYNRVLKATPDGTLRILAAWPNSPVTVGGTAGPDGNLYVAQFSPAPYNPGTGRIDRVAPDGTITEGVVKGLTTPIDVAFAPDGTMYVLRYAAEFSPEKLRYLPFGGEVQRVKPDGTIEPVVTNLVFPTSLAFGRDGALYVTNFGNEANEGQGQVLRVLPGDRPVKGPEVMTPDDTQSYVAPQNTPAARPDSSLVAARVNIVEPTNSEEWGYTPRRSRSRPARRSSSPTPAAWPTPPPARRATSTPACSRRTSRCRCASTSPAPSTISVHRTRG